jgi:nucleotidyltransferase substrate binding protein (TIGR01987 family)
MNEYVEGKILQFESMFTVFKNSLVSNATITERTAAIKNFELTFELSWKAMKRLLEFRESENLSSTTAVIKKAFSYGLISNENDWLEIIGLRNKAVHAYGEVLAINVFENLHSTIKSFESCLFKMKSDMALI